MYPHVTENSANAQRVVSLNVGGTIFTTSLHTLKSDPESTLAGELLSAGTIVRLRQAYSSVECEKVEVPKLFKVQLTNRCCHLVTSSNYPFVS